jgi:hypothetical protein
MWSHLLVASAYMLALLLFTWLLHKQRIGLPVATMLLALASLAVRWWYMPQHETGPDASIWLASAISVTSQPDPFWWLATSNEGRPLTVLPLVLLHYLGVPLSYPAADYTGLAMYMGAFALMLALLRRLGLDAWRTWLLGLPLFATLATTSLIDYTSYNCQAPSLLVLMICLHLLHRQWQHRLQLPGLLLLGLLLGALPLIKFQNAPAGLLLGGASLLLCWQRRQWLHLLRLCLAALLPVAAIALIFASAHRWQDFINDYFNNYFFYAYTEEYSADDFWHRYSPRRIISFIFRTTDSAILLAGSVALLGWQLFKTKGRLATNAAQWLALLLLLSQLYAVVQSGWNTPHYLLYLWMPPLLYLGTLMVSKQPHKIATGTLLIMAMLQVAINQQGRRTQAPAYPVADQAVVRKINRYSSPGQSIHVWGHADRFYVMAQRPMGMRLADNWWILRQGPMQARRIAEWLYDMDRHRPVLIVDNTRGPDAHHFQFKDSDLMSTALIGDYVRQHYELKDSTRGALFYIRKK